MSTNYLKHPIAIGMFLAGGLLFVASLLGVLNTAETYQAALKVMQGTQQEKNAQLFLNVSRFFPMGIGVFGLLFSYLAAKNASKIFSILNILFSLVLSAGLGFLYLVVSSTEQRGASGSYAISDLIKPGIGFYIALVGAIILLLASLVSLFVFKKQKN